MASGRTDPADPGATQDPQLLGWSAPDSYTAHEQGPGWIAFAGIMLLIIGTLNVIYGIAAIDDAHFYDQHTDFAVATLHTWGWLLVAVGAMQFLAGIGIFLNNQLARWIGIVSAGGNAIMQLLFLPSFPLLSVTLFAVDVLVLYALISFGGRHRAAL